MSALAGHDAQIERFLAAFGSGHPHHGWLLTGPKGIGKASFARAAALRLLAEAAGPPPGLAWLAVPATHPVAALVAAGTHPDLLQLSRLFREKTNDHARNITVDQVRELRARFTTLPSLSHRRVVIVDAADDLEPSGANALLKSLEEPPAGTIFLLVSHAPGRLLPTIRSRCRTLRFGALDDDVMTSVLKAALPEAGDDEIAALVRNGQGAPGRALRHAGLDVAGLDRTAEQLVSHGDPGNGRRAALAKALSGRAAQARYEAFLDRAPSHLAAAARLRQGSALAETIALWERARVLAESAVRLSLDPQTTVFELAGLLASAARQPRKVHG